MLVWYSCHYKQMYFIFKCHQGKKDLFCAFWGKCGARICKEGGSLKKKGCHTHKWKSCGMECETAPSNKNTDSEDYITFVQYSWKFMSRPSSWQALPVSERAQVSLVLVNTTEMFS